MVDRLDEHSQKLVRTPAADLWRHTLSQIPTSFGRLVYLASLRNPNSGIYEHHGLAQIYGSEEADRTLRESHRQVFSEWLCFNLGRQKLEVTEYMSGLSEGIRLTIENWIRLSPYRYFMPAETREAERRLYLTDLEAVIGALRDEHGVAVVDPDA